MSVKDFFRWLTTPPADTGYPTGKHEGPVYIKTPLMDEELNVIAYVEQLTCPVCEHLVKRADRFCKECGNQLIAEASDE